MVSMAKVIAICNQKGGKRKDKPFKPLILLGFLICLNYIVKRH